MKSLTFQALEPDSIHAAKVDFQDHMSTKTPLETNMNLQPEGLLIFIFHSSFHTYLSPCIKSRFVLAMSVNEGEEVDRSPFRYVK